MGSIDMKALYKQLANRVLSLNACRNTAYKPPSLPQLVCPNTKPGGYLIAEDDMLALLLPGLLDDSVR